LLANDGGHATADSDAKSLRHRLRRIDLDPALGPQVLDALVARETSRG
jgi:hypothetical protein